LKDLCRERDATSRASALTRRELHSELQALGSSKYILNHYDKRISTCLKRDSKYTDLDLDLVAEEDKQQEKAKGKAKTSNKSSSSSSSSLHIQLHQDGAMGMGVGEQVNKQALEGLGAEYNVYKERLVGEKRQRKDLVQTFRSVSAKKEREQEELAAVMDFEGRLSKEVQQQKEGVVRIQSLFEKEVKYRQGVTQSTFAQYLPLPLHILLAQAAFEAKKWNKNNLKKKKLGNSNNNSLSLSLSVSIGGSSDDLHEYLSRLSQTSAHSLLSQKKANGNGNSKEGGSESES
jgi:hypothetical protein